LAFRGQYEHSLDAKDRLTIPARWRSALAEGVVVFADLDPCVAIFPPPAYDRMSERYLGSLSPFSRDARMMKRRFHASSSDESLDAAGRVRLSRQMIERAGLARTCVVVGVDDHIEVWNPERWAAEQNEIAEQTDRMARALAGGGTG
jgi:MraZ protein